jgi:endonuclease/exonuclease/phosphatase (EEP) superfamily protein YafD
MNRTGYDAFKNQLEILTKLITEHKGPIIFGGDFNTNSKDKRKFLFEFIESVNLKEVLFLDDHRTVSALSRIPLDWIFVRELTIIESSVMLDLHGSDHHAMKLVLEVEKKKIKKNNNNGNNNNDSNRYHPNEQLLE